MTLISCSSEVTKTDSKQAKVVTEFKKSQVDVHQLETVPSEKEFMSSSGKDDHLHNILQLGNKSITFLFNTTINGVAVEKELESGANWLTVP